jgi:hypothetical protein
MQIVEGAVAYSQHRGRIFPIAGKGSKAHLNICFVAFQGLGRPADSQGKRWGRVETNPSALFVIHTAVIPLDAAERPDSQACSRI